MKDKNRVEEIKSDNSRRKAARPKHRDEMTPEERAQFDKFGQALVEGLCAGVNAFFGAFISTLQNAPNEPFSSPSMYEGTPLSAQQEKAIVETREVWENPIESTDNEVLTDLTDDCKVQ